MVIGDKWGDAPWFPDETEGGARGERKSWRGFFFVTRRGEKTTSWKAEIGLWTKISSVFWISVTKWSGQSAFTVSQCRNLSNCSWCRFVTVSVNAATEKQKWRLTRTNEWSIERKTLPSLSVHRLWIAVKRTRVETLRACEKVLWHFADRQTSVRMSIEQGTSQITEQMKYERNRTTHKSATSQQAE